MVQKYDLVTLPVLNSMHDQRIKQLELKDKMFILHYRDLHCNTNMKFSSCDVIFSGIEDADIVAEIRVKDGLVVEGTKYYDTEFLAFINQHQYSIETISFYYGYKTVVIEAALVNKEGAYSEDCIIKISAPKVEYQWS